MYSEVFTSANNLINKALKDCIIGWKKKKSPLFYEAIYIEKKAHLEINAI